MGSDIESERPFSTSFPLCLRALLEVDVNKLCVRLCYIGDKTRSMACFFGWDLSLNT